MVGRRRLADSGAQDAGGDGRAGQPSDAELLRRHVAGDSEAFGTLFLRHRDRLWAVALRTVCDPDDAADALQEAMISAFRRAGDFRGESAVTTWLHRIVVNASLDRLRRRQTHSVAWSGDEDALETLAAQGRGSSLAGTSATAVAGAAGGVPSTDGAEAIETRLEVDAALRMLPVEQRAALVLVDMMGYPVAEVAEILAISPGTVKSRCARGRARLLPYLSHLRTKCPPPGNRPDSAGVSSEQEGGE
jgi:RNA polymerase sigma-70 factor (ECF subfamily)